MAETDHHEGTTARMSHGQQEEPDLAGSRRMGMPRRLLMLPASAWAVVVLTSGCMSATRSVASPGVAASSRSEPASARVKVELNHCFVQPVWFDGELWNVPFKKQFGWGGIRPKHWQGAGIMVREAENEARFQDDRGPIIVFRPADAPSVRAVETALCD